MNYSIRVTCHVFRRNLFVERKTVYLLISVPCIESFPRLPTQKSFGLLKASGSQSTVRVPRVERNLWNAAKVSTEPSRKSNKLQCFQGVSFQRNCGAASVGVLQDNLVLSTELIM